MEWVPVPAVPGLKDDPETPGPEKIPPAGDPERVTACALMQYDCESPEKLTLGGGMTVTVTWSVLLQLLPSVTVTV